MTRIIHGRVASPWRPPIEGHPCLDDILDLARRGLSVFPIPPGTKVPYDTFRWSETSSRNPFKLRKAWHEHDNIGVDCLQSGIVVIDLDPRANATVIDEMHELIGADAPDTYWTETGGRGQHWYFLQPGGIGCPKRHGLPDGVDVKGEGGMVLGAGSWAISKEKGYSGPYVTVDDGDFNYLPDVLLELLCAQKPRKFTSVKVRRYRYTRMSRKQMRAFIDERLERITVAQDGEQNDTILEAACRFGEIVSTDLWTYEKAEDALLQASLEGNHPYDRAIATIRSGLRIGSES